MKRLSAVVLLMSLTLGVVVAVPGVVFAHDPKVDNEDWANGPDLIPPYSGSGGVGLKNPQFAVHTPAGGTPAVHYRFDCDPDQYESKGFVALYIRPELADGSRGSWVNAHTVGDGTKMYWCSQNNNNLDFQNTFNHPLTYKAMSWDFRFTDGDDPDIATKIFGSGSWVVPLPPPTDLTVTTVSRSDVLKLPRFDGHLHTRARSPRGRRLDAGKRQVVSSRVQG